MHDAALSIERRREHKRAVTIHDGVAAIVTDAEDFTGVAVTKFQQRY
jgi:hypothetical protein